MASHEVIDLLSSDNEAPVQPRISANKKRADAVFAFLPDNLDNTVHLDSNWDEGPSKRRRLSPPIPRKDDLYALPQLRPPGLGKHVSTSEGRSLVDEGWATIDGSDPIVFTSSLGTGRGKGISCAKREALDGSSSHGDSSDDSLPDDIFSAPSLPKPSALSARTAAILESLPQPPRARPSDSRKPSADRPLKTDKFRSKGSIDDIPSSGSEAALTKVPKASKKPKLTEEEKAAKAREKDKEKATKSREKENARAASKEQKAKEKEEEQERKRLLKEGKAREKRIAADLAEVNKSKLDKKDSTPEMIVDLPASIDGQSVDTQIREFLKALGVDATLYQSPIPHVIRWRRKMKARWNADLDHWEPIEHMEIHEEKHVMCLLSAKEFIALATMQVDQGVETHVAMLKSAYHGCVPIYLIEGLHIWMRKNKTAENRAYQAKVNSLTQAEDAPSASQPASRRKKPAAETIDEDLIEDALLRLQVMNNCLVHHTSTSVESAEWVANFTQHISTIPYRTQRLNLSTSFCMESGQVKTGEDKDDTFVKMLQEIVRVTPPIAYGIASEYPTVIALVTAFRKHGPNVLEDLQKSANRNGALTDRRIGKAISRRLYKVFMESDPASTDV